MYEKCMRVVKMGSCTPLVFSTFGNMGCLGTTVFKKLASLLASQHDQPYSFVMAWTRGSISFSLL